MEKHSVYSMVSQAFFLNDIKREAAVGNDTIGIRRRRVEILIVTNVNSVVMNRI